MPPWQGPGPGAAEDASLVASMAQWGLWRSPVETGWPAGLEVWAA